MGAFRPNIFSGGDRFLPAGLRSSVKVLRRSAFWLCHVALVVASLAAGGLARAATATWTGSTNNNWSNSGNWSGLTAGATPGSSDDVIVDGSAHNVAISIDTNVDVNSLTVQGAYTRTIAPTGAQTLRTRANLTLSPTSSGGSLTLSSATTQIGGAFSRTNNNLAVNANGGTVLFNSTGSVSHTFSGAQLGTVTVGLNNGLVGYWPLDESSGSAIADSSGNGNGGTLSGSFSRTSTTPPLTFSDPEAVTLSGGYASLGINNLPANNAVQSISLWVKLVSNGGTQNMIALANSGSSSGVQVGIRGGGLTAWSWGGGTLISTSLPSTGVWHHVAYTWDGTNNQLYLDGVAATSTTTAHQIATPSQAFLGTYDGADELLSGSLDDVRVYNRALSSTEVSTLAAGGTTSTTAGTHTFADAFSASGSFTISAGTVKGSSALTVGGSWVNSGTFSGTGTVTLTGTTAGNSVVSGGSSFAALTVNGAGGTYTFSDAFTSTGNFTITAGTVTGTSAMSVGGNWSSSGTFTGTGTVTLTGTGSSGTILSGGSRFSALTLAGAGGTYTLSDRLWVPGGTVTLSNGTLNGGSSVLHVGSFVQTSGTFVPASGTVVLDGTSNQTLAPTSFNALRLEEPRETNLVGYWKLDEGQGTTLYDLSGSGDNGTLSAAGATRQTTVPASVGFDDAGSVILNGTSGYASLGITNLPANNAAQTISLWANFSSTGGTQNMIALDNAGAGSGVQLGIRGGNVTVWGWGGGTLVAATPPSTGAWHHLAYTFDGASDTLYIDGVAVATAASTHSATSVSAAVAAAYLGTYDGGSELYGGSLDDVRVYKVALTAAQIAQLAAGRYAGTGGYATVTLGGSTAVSGQLAVDADNLNAGGQTLTASLATSPALINAGSYAIGSAAQTFSGGLTVQPAGTITLASSGGSLAIASGKTLTVDGTLNASSSGATIKSVSGTYTFKVGSTATATPTVNISGLAVQNTDTNGMWIGATTAATPTVTKLDNVAFSKGTGTQLLQINAKTLFLSSSGCSFDSGVTTTTTYSVALAGDGTANGETRAVFGGATCASSFASCQASKKDDDANNDGVGDNPGSNGAVAQFVRAAQDDTAGSIVGFPTAAFDWNTFSYYATYVAFHDAVGTTDVVYVRNETGTALYSWTVPTAGEAIIGTPQWNTVSSKHYLYVATTAGHVYRLVDNGSSSLILDASGAWASNPYSCGCTITTPLTQDASNLYFGGTASGQKLWTVGQATESIPTGSPFSITPTITSTAPAIWTSGSTNLFLGLTGHILKINVSNQTLSADNSSPGTASVWGRISVGTGYGVGTTRIYAGDDGGTMWAIAPTNFAGTNKLWSYHTANAIMGSAYYDYLTDTVQYGTQGGTVIVLNGSGAVLNTSYPYTPGAAGDAITAAPLFSSGVLAVGSTGGKLYFIDRNNGASTPAAALIREYYFGPSESVSGVAFDPTVNRYMVTTGNPATNDGRLYYFDLIADPTPGSS